MLQRRMKSLGILEKPLNKKTPIIYKITKKMMKKKADARSPLPLETSPDGVKWERCGVSLQSSQRRADAQQLVTTRLLDCVHDPAGQLSRLQRIQSYAW